MALESLAIPLDGYDSSLHGMKLGTTVWAYGKRFRLVEVHTTLASTELTQYSPVVYQDTAFTITDDVSEGLVADYPLAAGFVVASGVPISTSSVTYYCWVQEYGVIHTTPEGATLASVPANTDDDIAAGDLLIVPAGSDAVVDSISDAADESSLIVGQYMRSIGTALVDVTAATDVVTGVFANVRH